MSGQPLLEAIDLSRAFGALQAVRQVSLTVMAGEIHALIGPNGAGKSTMIALLHGALRPDQGRIRFAGREISGLGASRRARLGLARTFQKSAVFEEFSVLQNVALAIRAAQGGSARCWQYAGQDCKVKKAASLALEQVGLHDLKGRLAKELAHGQMRQLEMAMVLAADPKLMLLDEPMAGLGQSERQATMVLFERLRQAHAMLLVEHDMDVVFALADRISVLVNGSLIASGEPAAIKADPAVRRAYLDADGGTFDAAG